MARSHGDGDLVAAIYDAIIEPSGWDDVVKRIVEATGSVSGVIGIHQIDRPAHRIVSALVPAMYNIDPFWSDAFVQNYHKNNPLDVQVLAAMPGKVIASTFITQTDSFKACAFYNEFMRPQGQAENVGIGLVRTPITAGYLALQRSPASISLEPEQWKLLEKLGPHLQRAAAIQDLLSRTRAMTGSLGAALAAAGFAVFLLTADCRVVFANAKAEDLARRQTGLRYEHARLAATSPALTARLRALARKAASPKPGEAHAGGTLELCCGENRPPLVAHVIPLAPNRTVAIFDFDRPAAAVFIVDPAADLGAQIQHFGARFGLAPAETRVLREIIAGKGLPAAAARLKITELTARTHAKHIFDKTGTSRQTELIRRFFEAALPGSPSGT
ncbi:MAG: helix-turn-helix transcriptional regulator [Methylocella sp.]